jgi:hypothetical protein
MKKPGTKLGKLVAVDNRENTFGKGYYNGVGRIESGVGRIESGVGSRESFGNQGGIAPKNIEQGILNDEGREMAAKALRRKVSQRI